LRPFERVEHTSFETLMLYRLYRGGAVGLNAVVKEYGSPRVYGAANREIRTTSDFPRTAGTELTNNGKTNILTLLATIISFFVDVWHISHISH